MDRKEEQENTKQAGTQVYFNKEIKTKHLGKVDFVCCCKYVRFLKFGGEATVYELTC